MITEAYHSEKESMFSPEAFLGERKYICDTAIATFSNEIFEAVLDTYPHREAGHNATANGHRPIYLIEAEGMKLIFYMTSVGASPSGIDLIEMQWQTGVKNIIMTGSAGVLDSEATKGKFIIPTEAYRDEGMSYHYAPASDYIGIKNSDKLAGIFSRLGIPFVKGRVWTTDAPYRETKVAIEKRRQDGCIAVEMELAGVQAVCSFYGMELYNFLESGDVLYENDYTPQGLSEANHSLDKFFIALKIAKEIEGGNI